HLVAPGSLVILRPDPSSHQPQFFCRVLLPNGAVAETLEAVPRRDQTFTLTIPAGDQVGLIEVEFRATTSEHPKQALLRVVSGTSRRKSLCRDLVLLGQLRELARCAPVFRGNHARDPLGSSSTDLLDETTEASFSRVAV